MPPESTGARLCQGQEGRPGEQGAPWSALLCVCHTLEGTLCPVSQIKEEGHTQPELEACPHAVALCFGLSGHQFLLVSRTLSCGRGASIALAAWGPPGLLPRMLLEGGEHPRLCSGAPRLT